MHGLELSENYFKEYGLPMLQKDFADILPLLAAGFTGSGSDRYGFDDEISQDHDYEPGFCIFLPGEDVIDRKTAFRLERAYAKLPKEFMGVKRTPLSPVGGNRNGVMRTSEFFRSAAGYDAKGLTLSQWLHTPDSALAEAVNGKLYFDNFGEVTAIRKYLKTMPEDILLKRLAGNLLLMAQSGQYNYLRCVKHGEPEAAQLACFEFVNAAIKTFFLLNGGYAPYYKWAFRALRQLPGGKSLAEELSRLLSLPNSDKNIINEKYSTIEKVSAVFIHLLKERSWTEAVCGDLEKHAYSVNDRIKDGEIRNMHILTTV